MPNNQPNPYVAIYRALREGVAGFKAEYVKCICPLRKKLCWLVKLDKEFDASTLYNSQLKYENNSFELLDPNNTNNQYTCVLRVHWLPPNISSDVISGFVCSYMDCEAVGIAREHYKIEEHKHIENGVFRVKIRIQRANKAKIDKLIGKNIISGLNTLNTRVGDPPM
jgi:hypothetical protein